MQHNPAPSNQTQGEITLTQVNELLNATGLPMLNKERAAQLFQSGKRDRIVSAIRSASVNPRARDFLINLFNATGIPVNLNSKTNPVPQPGQNQQEHPQQSYEQAKQGSPSRPPQQRQQEDRGAPPIAKTTQQPEIDRMSVHVYGGKAALCFEADTTKNDVPTIALDAALTTGPRQYDWGNKIRLQMTRAELPVVAAVLIGAMQSCEFKNHGADNSKGFSMERQQGGKVFIKVFAKDMPLRTVPVMAADVFYVASLVMRQIRKANPWLDSTALMSLIRATQGHQ